MKLHPMRICKSPKPFWSQYSYPGVFLNICFWDFTSFPSCNACALICMTLISQASVFLSFALFPAFLNLFLNYHAMWKCVFFCLTVFSSKRRLPRHPLDLVIQSRPVVWPNETDTKDRVAESWKSGKIVSNFYVLLLTFRIHDSTLLSVVLGACTVLFAPRPPLGILKSLFNELNNLISD